MLEEDEAWGAKWQHSVATRCHSPPHALCRLALYINLCNIRSRYSHPGVAIRSYTYLRHDVDAYGTSSNGNFIALRC